MANNRITTIARRNKLAKISAGTIPSFPKITQIAFGDGGVDIHDVTIPPTEDLTGLRHELFRYPAGTPTFPRTGVACYTVEIPVGAQTGAKISEFGIIDADGDFCGIASMLPKSKDEYTSMRFEIEDGF